MHSVVWCCGNKKAPEGACGERGSTRLCEEFVEDRLSPEEFDLIAGEQPLVVLHLLLQVLDADFSHLDFEFEDSLGVDEEGLALDVHRDVHGGDYSNTLRGHLAQVKIYFQLF